MSAIQDTDEKKATSSKARKSSARKRSTRRTSPPNSVQPGPVHEAVAAFLLDALRNRTSVRIGVPLDVGHLEDADKGLVTSEESSGKEPVELLARILAHIGHRIPFFSRVEKRLEGKEAKSGLASDVVAFLMQLWSRNRELAPVVVATAQQARAASKSGPERPVTDVTDATDSVFPQPNTGGV